MIFKRMREQILDKAIRGLLVPQLAEDGVVDQIGEAPAELPFNIPKSWKWVSLKRIGEVVSGATPKTAVKEFWNGDINWVTPADLGKNTSKWIAHGSRFLSQEGLNSCSAVLMPKGSIVYSSRAPIGHIAIAANELCTNQGCKSFVPKCEYISTEWAYYALIARTKDIQSRASGTTFKEISGTGMGNTLIPLPPIAEQKRIAAKIESLFDEIECAEKAYEELQSLANVLRGQILQKAIQGKLVPQLPEDGVVEQIGEAPAEVAFELPASWKWCKLESIASIVRGASPRPIKNFLTTDEDGINWIKIGDSERGSKYISKCAEKITYDGSLKSRFVKRGSLLLTNSMSYGYPYILNVDGCIHDGWLSLSDFDNFINKEFLYYMLLSNYCRSVFVNKAAGAVVKNLNIDKVKSVYIPLPPLAEQNRIVAKVETLLEQIDLMTK